MYVGLTRAKELVTLSWPAKTRRWGELQRNQPSRFLLELPRADLHWQGEDAQADQETRQESAQAHLAKIKAMLADG